MKKLSPFFSLVLFYLGSVFITPAEILAQNNEGVIYVWEFTTRDGERDDITMSFTEEFEEALIQLECCTILQRRHYSRLFDQKQNESSIRNLNGLSKSALDGLKSLEAKTVVFGEIYDDTNSGQLKVSINFESFDGKIVKKASTYLPKYAIADPVKREEAVEKLIAELNLIPKLKPPTRSKTIGEWEFALTGCYRSGNSVICDFTVKSNYRERNFTIYGQGNLESSVAFDEFNFEYKANDLQLANKQHNRNLGVKLIANVLASGKIIFSNVSTRATQFPLLEFGVRGDDLSEKKIQFRNVFIE